MSHHVPLPDPRSAHRHECRAKSIPLFAGRALQGQLPSVRSKAGARGLLLKGGALCINLRDSSAIPLSYSGILQELALRQAALVHTNLQNP